MEMKKISFSRHVGNRTFIQIHETWGAPFLKIVWQFFVNLPIHQSEVVRRIFVPDDYHHAYIPSSNIADPYS